MKSTAWLICQWNELCFCFFWIKSMQRVLCRGITSYLARKINVFKKKKIFCWAYNSSFLFEVTMVHVIRWGKKYFSLKNQVNYKHAPDKRDFNCVECIRRRRSCHTCHTVNVCDSRRASLELREEAQWQKTDVISGLRSCQHVSANNDRYAGLPFFCLPGMRSSLCCRRGFTGGIMW